MPEIWFPNLGIKIYHLSPYFTVFGRQIYWYAVCITAGMFAGLFLAYREAKRVGHDFDRVYFNFFFVLVIFGILGARVYYVLFNWDRYSDNLLDIFKINEGGLAIYGGLLAVLAAGVIFAKRLKIDFWEFADVVVPCVCVGQAIGRFGNFVGREVFGGYSEGLFAMRYLAAQVPVIPPSVAEKMVYIDDTAYIQVAPTFLYEALWNIGLFCVLTYFQRHKSFNGQIFLMYFAGYGIGRFWIEAVRTDQLFIGSTNIPVSMVVAAVTAVISIILLIYFLHKKNKKKDDAYATD